MARVPLMLLSASDAKRADAAELAHGPPERAALVVDVRAGHPVGAQVGIFARIASRYVRKTRIVDARRGC